MQSFKQIVEEKRRYFHFPPAPLPKKFNDKKVIEEINAEIDSCNTLLIGTVKRGRNVKKCLRLRSFLAEQSGGKMIRILQIIITLLFSIVIWLFVIAVLSI